MGLIKYETDHDWGGFQIVLEVFFCSVELCPCTLIKLSINMNCCRKVFGCPKPAVVQPDDIDFEPSLNGERGWNYDEVYKVGPELGKGAFGVVIRAQHKWAPEDSAVAWKNVAIKRTEPTVLDKRRGPITTLTDVRSNCGQVAALLRLKKDCAQNTPVLHLYEFFWRYDRRAPQLYIVTELLHGSLLDFCSQTEGITERMAKETASTILKGISYMHSCGVVHRNLKLQAILFRDPGNLRSLKITSFVFARILENGETTRGFCGSGVSISPECYQDEEYRFEVDMFAFGGILFRLLSGLRPFSSIDQDNLRRDTIDLRYSVQGNHWRGISDSAKDLIRGLLTYKENRLTVEEALGHPWFVDVDQ